jgi:sulfate adenylyltransferase subunit 1
VSAKEPATVAKSVTAALVWMDQKNLELNHRYLLKHTSHTVPAFIPAIQHRTDVSTLKRHSADTFAMNDIGVVTLSLLRPIAVDLYSENRSTGAFILIDPKTNSTVAAGMIQSAQADTSDSGDEFAAESGPVTAGERAARWGHQGGELALQGPAQLIDAIERSLFAAGVITQRIETSHPLFTGQPGLLEAVTSLQVASGLLVLIAATREGDELTVRINDRELVLNDVDTHATIAAIHQLLHQEKILFETEGAGL